LGEGLARGFAFLPGIKNPALLTPVLSQDLSYLPRSKTMRRRPYFPDKESEPLQESTSIEHRGLLICDRIL
jgi:hypothetical protein